jgi:hypothetical protein
MVINNIWCKIIYFIKYFKFDIYNYAI